MADDLPKLVRDRIPEIIEKNNQDYRSRKASEDEMEEWLRKKVLEEAREFAEDGEIDELADLYAVISEYLEREEKSFSKLDKIEERKATKRGAFKNNIILEEVEDD